MNIAKLHAGAHALLKKNPSLRYGQALFAYLADTEPDLAKKVTGTDVDPFYDDDRASAFFAWLAEQPENGPEGT